MFVSWSFGALEHPACDLGEESASTSPPEVWGPSWPGGHPTCWCPGARGSGLNPLPGMVIYVESIPGPLTVKKCFLYLIYIKPGAQKDTPIWAYLLVLIFVLRIVFLVLRIVRHEHNREHKKEHKNGHSGAQEHYRIWACFLVLIFVLWIVFLVLRIVRLVSVKRSPVLLRLVLLPYYSRTTPVLLRYYSSTSPVSTP